jgi:hypothetical protein
MRALQIEFWIELLRKFPGGLMATSNTMKIELT